MSKLQKVGKREPSNWYMHVFFVIYCLLCIVPFLLIVAISVTAEKDISIYGYKLIPHNFSSTAYTYVFTNIGKIVKAYGVTIVYAFGGAALSILLMGALGYTLVRKHFIFRKPLSYMLIITMFFSGGLIPSYIINTKVYHIGNSMLIYLFSGLVSAYTVFVFRTFFSQLPESLYEAAELDGASEMQLLTKIILPLSTPVIATYTFMQIVSRWNDFSVTMYYIQDTNLYTLQFLLQQILNEAKFLAELQKTMPISGSVAIPDETLKYAMCVVASGPMLVLFPFFQKYFAKGMTVGAVKG